MRILLVNDDGIDSPFLMLLCRAAAARGHEVFVCAPSVQQSAKSHAFSTGTPLFVHHRDFEGAARAWAVDGTPVDCARLGLMTLCKPIDLTLSGINLGYNVGLATFVSGTVGAARESAFQGAPAMAVSAEPRTPKETMSVFADWAVALGERLVHYDAPPLSVCNVNAPCVPLAQLKEPRMCDITRNIYKDHYERRISPRGDEYYWLTPEEQDDHPTPGSDLDLLQRGHLTCTFLTPNDACDQHRYADLLTNL